VTNAFQHAFPHVDRGVITVRLVSDDRRIILTVLDNGRGLPADAEGPGSRGLGLHLVRLLATRQLRGRVSISRRGGTQFTVTFPLAARDQLSRSARSQRESKAP
jgi:two-component sensor histidine kinase